MDAAKKTRCVKSEIILLLFAVLIILPAAAVCVNSLFEHWTGILPEGLTLKNYDELFSDREFIRVLGQTVALSLIPTAIMSILILLAMYALVFAKPQTERFIRILALIPYAFQGVVLSLSVMSLYGNASNDSRNLLLIGTYSIVVFPVLYQSIKNSISSVDGNIMIENAVLLGASPFRAYLEIVVPSAGRSILAGAMLSVTLLLGDYVIVRNMAGRGVSNLQVYLYQAMKSSPSRASAVFVIILILTFLITSAVQWLSKGIIFASNGKKD